MRPFAIAGVQAEVYDHEDNVAYLSARVDAMMRQFPWIEMVVLSELCAQSQQVERAEPLGGPTETAWRELARRHDLWLVPGSIYHRIDGKVYNVAPVIAPDGAIVGRYRKMFPFQPYEAGVSPGDAPLVFDIPTVGRFGVSICYDMWFPETSRWLAWHGVEVILHPTLTDTVDRDVELAIVRATAAQNQCFVIDVNGTVDGGTGRSLVVGPSGEIIHLAGSAPEMIPIEIDLDRVSRGRERGIRGLGQPLKSFRDGAVAFPCYQPGARSEYLDSLGPVRLPARSTRPAEGETS